MIRTVGLMVVLAGLVFGQAAEPPDRAAYRQAVLTPDARGRVDGLRKFVAAYPKSSRVGRANDLILKTLVQNWPEQTAEIHAQVKVLTHGVSNSDKPRQFDSVADTLVRYGAGHAELMVTADQLETEARKHFDAARMLAGLKKQTAGAKVPVDNQALVHYVDEVHSELLSTMGRIDVAREKAEAGKPLLEEAAKVDPGNSDALAALGDLAMADKREKDALSLLADAQLAGILTPKRRSELEDLNRKFNGGGNLDSWLDQVYRQKFPEPVKAEAYKPGGPGSGKTVLAELFTGSGCGPCAGADLAMDAEMERYPKNDLVVLMFHEHIPEPDPMANPATVSRFSFYSGTGTPTLVVDGEAMPAGGGDRGAAQRLYSQFTTKIDAALHTKVAEKLTLQARRQGDLVTVRVHVDGAVGAERLQVALVEKQVRYSGENGIRFHPMVVRAMAGADANGFSVIPDGGRDFEATFDAAQISGNLKMYLDGYEMANDRFGPVTFTEKKYAIDAGNLAVVAFTQDAATKHVNQAAYADATDN